MIQAARKKNSESKPLDLCCENSDFLFRATCVVVSTAFLKIIILHQNRRYQSDPIRNTIQSGVRCDLESHLGFVNGRLIIILEIVYRGEHDTTNCKEKTFTVQRYGIWSTLSNLSANYIPLVHSIYSITFKPKNCSEYFRAMIRIWVMFTYLKAWLYNNMPNMDHLGEKWVFTL